MTDEKKVLTGLLGKIAQLQICHLRAEQHTCFLPLLLLLEQI